MVCFVQCCEEFIWYEDVNICFVFCEDFIYVFVQFLSCLCFGLIIGFNVQFFKQLVMLVGRKIFGFDYIFLIVFFDVLFQLRDLVVEFIFGLGYVGCVFDEYFVDVCYDQVVDYVDYFEVCGILVIFLWGGEQCLDLVVVKSMDVGFLGEFGERVVQGFFGLYGVFV